MATEEEAREATDGQEVQVEAANDLQAQFDSKLSSIKEIKGEAQTMDSTEGILKISEDEVLVEAPSETKIPSEHSLNGMTSSLNGHVDKEENISNEQPHEINQESQEQVENSADGTSTYPSNKSNEEEISHGESASEDSTILKCENAEAQDHGQQDIEGHLMNNTLVQEENSKTDDAIEQTVDAQDLDSSKETQPAIMTDIPADEVLAEVPAAMQSPLELNVDDSDTVPDTRDGNKETDEPAKEDDFPHLDHKESFPEDKVIAEHAEEEVKSEDQQSKQANNMDAEVLQEEIPESKESDLPENEQAKASIDDQEALNQEPALETNDSLSVKAEETCQQSNVATCGEKTTEDDVTTREPTVDTKEDQNQGSVEDMKDAEAVDTEEIVQQSSVAFDEAIQDHAATTNPSSDSQHTQSIEPEETKAPSDVKAEEVSSQSTVAFAEDAVQDKVIPSEPPEDIQPVQELEQEETKEADEASNETNPAIFSNLNQEDGIMASEPLETELTEEAAAFSNLDQEGGIADSESKVADLEEAEEIEANETEEITHQPPAALSTELPKEDNSTANEPYNDDIQHSLEQDSIEVNDTEAADIQGISQERTITTSKEDAVEDDGTAEGPTCVPQEVQDVESAEVKDTEADNVLEASNVVTVDDAGQENNVLTSENIAQLQLQGLESEEIKSPEPIETEADFNTSPAAPSNDPAEVNTTTCETQDTESAAEIKGTEDTKTESIPQESNISISQESSPEDSITASETISNTQELTIAGSIEASEDSKDTKTGEITDQSNEVFAGKAAQGDNIPESVSTADTQPMQELESEEMKKAELIDLSGTFHQMDDAISQKKNEEDNPTTCETNVIGSTEVSSVEVSEDQAIAHQSNITQCEEQATEESITESEPQTLEIDSVQDMEDTEATEPELVSEQNNVPTSEESVPEENASAKEPAFHDREIQNDGAELTEQHDGVKAEQIPNQSSGAIVEEKAQEANLLAGEPIDDVQVKDSEPEEISNTVDGETEEASHQTDAAVEDNWTGEVESSVEASEDQIIAHQSNITQCKEQATEESLTESEPQILEIDSVQDMEDTEATEPELVSEQNNVPTSEESVPEENASAKEPAFHDREIQNDGAELTKEHDGVKAEEIPDQSSGAIVEETAQEANLLASEPTDDVQVKELEPEEISNTVDGETEEASRQTHEVEMTESSKQMMETEPPVPEPESSEEMRDTEPTVPEPTLHDSKAASVEEIETQDNATIEQNVGYQKLQEQESVEFKETEALEPQGVIPSHNVASSEEFNPQETVTKEEPGSDTQAEESSVVIEDTEDVNNSAALSKKVAPEEHILATETTVDTPPVQEPELEQRQSIESIEAEHNIAASDLPGEEMDTEAIETESVPHESITTGVKELNEDVKSNVALAEEAASEEHILETEVTLDKSSAQKPELEEIKNTEPAEQEHNITETGLPKEEMKDNEAMETETAPHDSNMESIKELSEDDIITASAPDVDSQQVSGQESAEDMKCTDATEHPGETPESLVSISDELTQTGEITTVMETTFDTKQAQSFTDQETELSNFSNPEEEVQENDLLKSEPETDDSTTSGIQELNEDVKSNVALAEEAASEEHILETEVTVDKSSAQEPELEEIKNTEPAEQEHNITETGLPEEEMKDNEAMETETVPHDSNIESIKELREDDIITASAPDVDTQQVPEQETVEDIKCNDTTEHPGETPESIMSTSDELTQTGEITTVKETTFDTQQAQSFTDQQTELSSFPNPEEAVQESDLLKSEQETDVQQEQELDSTEETKGTEDYQQNGVSTFEESVTEVEPNVDDQHVQENKSAVEVKENEDTETEEISKLINFTTSENAAQESSEQEADQPFYVQPVQQLELTTDSKDNQLVEAEETSSQSNIVTPQDPTAEDRVANEIDPSVDIDQGHELELVEEIKDIDATEAEETSHTGQAISSAEQFTESNPSAAELTHGIQQVNDSEAMEEMKGTEDTGDEEICYQQTGTSEDPSPTDNGKSLQDYHVESNEENLGNGIGDVISVHEKIKDNIHESAELKDETSELGEKTQISANRTEENDDHISTEDTEETSNNINLVKEGSNEHGSSQTSNVQDNEQHDVGLQTQICERSVDIGQQDEDVKNVNLDQPQKEDEEITKQKEELQTDEQKHDDKRADFIVDTQVESIDAFEAEQTDSVVTEMLNDEVTQHESEDSIPRTTDAMVENITEIKETEEENGPNSGGTLEVSAKNYNEDVHEDTENDAVVEKTSSSEHDEIAGEIRNGEVEPCLASSLERDLQADPDLSNDQMLENNPIAVPQNDEYRLHGVEEGCTNKIIVDMHAIQESDKVIEDAEEKQEMQNEDNVVHHDESLVTTPKEETSHVHTDEQYSADTKMDDTAISYAEMAHENTSTEPREVEDTKEKKGFNDFPEFAVETSKQDDVDQDFSIHHQVEDVKSAATENNSAEAEAVQPKLDITIAETNNDNILSTTNPLPEHETENASDINQNRQYQEATNADAIDNIETGRVEKMETSYTATNEAVTLNEDICDKTSGADGVPPDESLKTSEDTKRNLDVSSVVTESEGENISKEMEDHKLAIPVHPTQDENTTEQGFGLEDTEKESMSPENALPAEPEEQEENQVTKEKDEEDRHDAELGDSHDEDHKEAEQDYLPVSGFLMNLILGKDNDDPKKDSETEVEKEQEETTKDDSCLIASQQEESLVAFPKENSVDEKLTFEQEKEKVEGSEETKEPVIKEQSHDVKMDVQKSLETDEELKRNTPDLEAPVYQDNAQDEISSKLISAKAADPIEKMEARDFELAEESFDTVCQENVEAATETEDGSLNRNQDDITSPKASQEDALKEVGTELPHESLHENRHDAKAEQTLSLIEPDIGNAEKLPNVADGVQSPRCTDQEESIESSYVEVRSTTEGQVESEVIETNEDQHTSAGGHTEEQIDNLHDDKLKGACSEEISDEQAPEITEPVSHTERNFAYEKEIPASSTCMDKKESMISNNKVNFEKALETHSDSPNLHVNQDKKDESADNQTVVEHNTMLDKLEDSNRQEEQETAAQKFPKETEGNQKFMAITEPVIKEENVHETVEGNTQAVKIISNEEQELFDSQVQERGLNVVSPKATSEADENFVEITKPEFSTDEEHNPKADESNMPEENTCDEKTKAGEETNNITDEATVKVEERGAEQKVSHKKHNILSGVGSKVKHQLAKVKKAIIGKPGHTKSESPKS
uniref:Uncharacterized protein n=1 Tax=Oryza punctata TaxID=4537 RepID=A0A0E0JV50_ORYPU